MEDRCPHRHAPLSAGCASGDGLACPYHGWRFGRDGALRAIPVPACRPGRRCRRCGCAHSPRASMTG
ncbi:Rieske 2Fe-2S domain-containing protein [Xanthomonas graminis]|uniref:Rieske 2Fe-2S domain-containing protein n=1 Tax=Xanthomonas graminis TaxID=3390026 RepID=UPI001F2A7F67|nr:Rieske 2Fe-2S domain-containing protein [Xanthomonas translucens]